VKARYALGDKVMWFAFDDVVTSATARLKPKLAPSEDVQGREKASTGTSRDVKSVDPRNIPLLQFRGRTGYAQPLISFSQVYLLTEEGSWSMSEVAIYRQVRAARTLSQFVLFHGALGSEIDQHSSAGRPLFFSSDRPNPRMQRGQIKGIGSIRARC
jgi:hypothetical protein